MVVILLKLSKFKRKKVQDIHVYYFFYGPIYSPCLIIPIVTRVHLMIMLFDQITKLIFWVLKRTGNVDPEGRGGGGGDAI